MSSYSYPETLCLFPAISDCAFLFLPAGTVSLKKIDIFPSFLYNIPKAEKKAMPLKKAKTGWPKGRLREIIVCAKNELSPFGNVFVFRPENFDEQKLGTIFGAIKLDDTSRESSYVVNLLTSVIKKEFFSKSSRFSEESFEVAMRKANLALAELARHGSLAWSGNLNFVCGALERNNLHFASLGNVSVYLLRSNQIAEISRDLEEKKDEETHPLKTFSNISSGKLEKGDKVIFTTGDLNEIFSPDELRQNAKHFSREEFPEFIKMSLHANSDLAASVILDFVEEGKPKRTLIEAPLAREEKIKKIDSFVSDIREEISSATKAEKTKEAGKNALLLGKLKRIFQKIIVMTRDGAILFREKGAAFSRRLTVRRKNASASLGIPTKKSFNVRSKVLNFSKIISGLFQKTTENQRYYFKLIGVSLVFITITVAISIRSRDASESLTAEEGISSEATPVLMLSDKEARRIENLETLTDISQSGFDMVFYDNKIYVVSQKSNSLFELKVESREVKEIQGASSFGQFGLLTAMPDLGALFILTNNGEVVTFMPLDERFHENSISFPPDIRIRSIKAFLTYFYVLDTANNQIYRYPRAEGGFGEGIPWFRIAVDLEGAKGFAVNEDLYLANADNVLVFSQGREKRDTAFELPRTALAVDKIISDPGMEFVWVLDSSHHRVVQFTRDGKITAQYMHESISGIQDFAVDENNQAIYLLKGNEILKFTSE